ncbi:hypothetical protein YN1_8030 [Nanoarchaeota archaeon]
MAEESTTHSSKNMGVTILRWIGLLAAALWTGIHIVASSIFTVPNNALATEVYRLYFGFISSLATASVVVYMLGKRNWYLPTLIFYVINFLLLIESRVGPAPLIGVPLPFFIPLIELDFALGLILIIVTALLWKLDKE